MRYGIGAVAFALCLVISVCLHEAGHMLTAKLFGMKVTRYFVGFGQTVFSFRRGETEYGLKAIPAGGFVTIVGMNPSDPDAQDLSPAEEHRAFWQFATWKRTVVLSAGSITHLLLAMLLLYVALVGFGVAKSKPADQIPATVGLVSSCVIPGYDVDAKGTLRACRTDDPLSPAKAAGLRKGDQITALGGTTVSTYADLQKALRSATVGTPLPMTYLRDGQQRTTTVTLISAQRPAPGTTDSVTHPTPTIGIASQPVVETVRSGPVQGLRQTGSLTRDMVTGSFKALGDLPSRIPPLFNSLFGAERSVNDPVSVVGATRIGGELVSSQGSSGIGAFLGLLASLNVFLGIFNLVPLPPLDGGHIAITWFERARCWLAARTGRPEPGMVDRNRLIPLTLGVLVLFGAFTLLTVSADILNPIQLG